MTGAKDVTLEPTKPKRQSFRGAVRQLADRVETKQREVEAAKRELDAAASKHSALSAEFCALTDAYNLVKPKPRTRKAKS